MKSQPHIFGTMFAYQGRIDVESVPASPEFSSRRFSVAWVNRVVIDIAASTYRPLPVLVVDDLPANRWILGRLLRELGLEVRFASDGSEAVALGRICRFGVILMDIEMREVDGDEAAGRLRLPGSRSIDVPIIAVTSLPLAEAKQRCSGAGIDSILSKPVTATALEKEIRRLAPHLL